MIFNELQVPHQGGAYSITIGADLLADNRLFNNHIVGSQVCIVSNTYVADLYLAKIKAHFMDRQCDVLLLSEGESYKTIESVMQIVDFLCQHNHHRDTTLIALGGGVIGDMVGFTAACYQRGVSFIQVPTTLLAQVDSSIGGKTGVNHPTGKNLIGAFYQPTAVIIDIDTLRSLPQREFLAGLAEIIKVALIQDAAFFDFIIAQAAQILNRDNDVLQQIILRSCEIKRDVVMCDERECGERALLNFGHTFGHAIEHCLGYGTWLHGEAVALGMHMAAALSCQLHYIEASELKRITDLLLQIGYQLRLPDEIDPQQLIYAMSHDKKVYKNRLNLILLERIGFACIKDDVPSGLIEALVYSYKS